MIYAKVPDITPEQFAYWLLNNWWEPYSLDVWVKRRSIWEGGGIVEKKTTKELYKLANKLQ